MNIIKDLIIIWIKKLLNKKEYSSYKISIKILWIKIFLNNYNNYWLKKIKIIFYGQKKQIKR